MSVTKAPVSRDPLAARPASRLYGAVAGSIVVQCRGCRLSIDPADTVVYLQKEISLQVGISAGRQTRIQDAYAHVGHERAEILRGYHEAGRGILGDLETKRNPRIG